MLHRTRDVEEVPIVERLEVNPGTGGLAFLSRIDCFGARLVRKDAGIGESVDLEIGAWWRFVRLRQPLDFLLILFRQRLERDPADDAVSFPAPREQIGSTNGEQKKYGQSFAHGVPPR